MRMRAIAASLLLVLGSTACYHAVVETGRPAGSTVIQKPWTSTWIFGLVEAKPIETASQCPGGVARVETQQSFANGLVGLVTLGIYTPQTVTITCATGGSASLPSVVVPAGATMEQKRAAVQAAAATSSDLGTAVLVRFEAR
jgi:hypothetical protein